MIKSNNIELNHAQLGNKLQIVSTNRSFKFGTSIERTFYPFKFELSIKKYRSFVLSHIRSGRINSGNLNIVSIIETLLPFEFICEC